jgi:hypothetical protein
MVTLRISGYEHCARAKMSAELVGDQFGLRSPIDLARRSATLRERECVKMFNRNPGTSLLVMDLYRPVTSSPEW